MKYHWTIGGVYLFIYSFSQDTWQQLVNVHITIQMYDSVADPGFFNGGGGVDGNDQILTTSPSKIRGGGSCTPSRSATVPKSS